MNPNIQCILDDETNQSCDSYIRSIMDPRNCNVPVKFQYTVQNIGTACEEIDRISGIIGVPSSQEGQNPAVSNIEFSDVDELCPGEEMVLFQRTTLNLCDLSDTTVGFELEMNGGGDNREGRGSIYFPKRNEVVM